MLAGAQRSMATCTLPFIATTSSLHSGSTHLALDGKSFGFPFPKQRVGSRIRCAADESEEGDFEARLAKLQKKVTGGSGIKAAIRKARKEGLDPASVSRKESSIFLPPAPLEEPVSDGLLVGLGFNSYTERLNGRFAALGLAAVVLVELATGGSFLKYHDSATLSVQLYAMLAAAALFVKYEREKVSVWPES